MVPAQVSPQVAVEFGVATGNQGIGSTGAQLAGLSRVNYDTVVPGFGQCPAVASSAVPLANLPALGVPQVSSVQCASPAQNAMPEVNRSTICHPQGDVAQTAGSEQNSPQMACPALIDPCPAMPNIANPNEDANNRPVEGVAQPASPQPAAQPAAPRQRNVYQMAGFKIERKCQLTAQLREQDFTIVDFSRLLSGDLEIKKPPPGLDPSKSVEVRNRVIFGVLYDCSDQERMANGELGIHWLLTDMRHPPRLVKLQVRSEAFSYWKSKRSVVKRGSVFAVINPRPIMDVRNGSSGGMPVLRVDKAKQIEKLGDCPSLGTCGRKGCRLPCSSDREERFCSSCTIEQRFLAGTTDAAAHCIEHLRGDRKGVQMASAAKEAVANAQEDSSKRARTHAALQLNNRVFSHSDAKGDYARAVCSGTKVGASSSSLSRVPVLGRGIDDAEGLEFTPNIMESSERKKSDRMIERMAAAETIHGKSSANHPPVKRQRLASDTCVPQNGCVTNVSSTASPSQPAKRPTFAELAEARKQKKQSSSAPSAVPAAARLAAAGAAVLAAPTPDAPEDGMDEPGLTDEFMGYFPGPSSVGSAVSSTAQLPGISATSLTTETTVDVETALKVQEKIEQLRAALASNDAPIDMNWLKAFFEDTERWPVEWLGTRAGGDLMDFVGDQFLSQGRPDLKPIAIQARRRWKELAFDAGIAILTKHVLKGKSRMQSRPGPSQICFVGNGVANMPMGTRSAGA